MDGAEALRSVKNGDCAPGGTIINRLMLRFRPIAPKPVSGDGALERQSLLVKPKRAKRKYVRVKPKKQGRSKGIYDDETGDGSDGGVVTLQLMPEKADLVKFRESSEIDLNVTENLDLMMSSNTSRSSREDLTTVGGVVESWVVVESVTGTCMDEEGLGRTDMSRMKNLESDTCPGFISDAQKRVVWVNKAYKDMVMMSWLGRDAVAGSSVEPEISIHLNIEEERWLVMRRYVDVSSFSCVVRVMSTYDDNEEKCRRSVFPCDVWRMDFGGLAWRLDLKAALTLGAPSMHFKSNLNHIN